jgi:hypothetical protein
VGREPPQVTSYKFSRSPGGTSGCGSHMVDRPHHFLLASVTDKKKFAVPVLGNKLKRLRRL